MKLMSITRTDNAVVAQMVRDAIVNDPSDKLTDIHDRAELWHRRARILRDEGRLYYESVADLQLDEFLCVHESNLGILDFWDGDIVDYLVTNGSEQILDRRTGVVRKTAIDPTIRGGGHAEIMFTNGETENCSWKYIIHSTIPQELVDIAKAQLMATHTCPLMEKDEEKKENENV